MVVSLRPQTSDQNTYSLVRVVRPTIQNLMDGIIPQHDPYSALFLFDSANSIRTLTYQVPVKTGIPILHFAQFGSLTYQGGDRWSQQTWGAIKRNFGSGHSAGEFFGDSASVRMQYLDEKLNDESLAAVTENLERIFQFEGLKLSDVWYKNVPRSGIENSPVLQGMFTIEATRHLVVATPR